MNKLRTVLDMIKVEHTVFALPFAFLGAFLAARGFPGWETAFWIVLAMTGARSAAMAFNRLADHHFDAANPRTAGRALPRGLVSRSFVAVFVAAASALFIVSAGMLNRTALYLSPVALVIVLLYSYTKRLTSASHLFLGLSLAIAPVGGWVAVRGELQVEPFYLALAVLCWVAGFDIIYACQDLDFDRQAGLFSLPGRIGIRHALRISSLLHLLMVLLLLYVFHRFELSYVSWLGLLLVSAGLIYEHRLVSPRDLSRVNAAFFTVNGLISLALFLFVGLDVCLSG